jgi:hypothetical protein
MINDDEWAEFQRVRLAEIPLNLGVTSVLLNAADKTFWVDNVRLFSTGFTFATHFRWKSDGSIRDPEEWPDLTPFASTYTKVTIELRADGELRSNVGAGTGVLHLVSANAVPGIADAEWWAPAVPREKFEISFSAPSRDAHGAGELHPEGWTSRATTEVRPIL